MKLLAKIIYFIRSLFVKTKAAKLTDDYGQQLEDVRLRKQTNKEKRDAHLVKESGYKHLKRVY